MRETRREPDVPEERVPVVECFDCPARITSKELAPIHSVKNGILQSACSTSPRKDADLGNSARMRIARLMNSLAKGPKKNGEKCSGYADKYTTIGLRIPGYGAAEVFIDFKEELRQTETDPMCKIHKGCCTSRRHAIARHIKIRDQNPSLGMICPGKPHQRNPQSFKI